MCQEAERRYLKTAFETACKMLANQYIIGATVDTGNVFEQDIINLGSRVSISPSYQQEQYPAYHFPMPIDMAFGLQDQAGSFRLQREIQSATGDCLTSHGHLGSLPSETFPLLAESRKKRWLNLDEDPTKTYLALDNTEIGNSMISNFDGSNIK